MSDIFPRRLAVNRVSRKVHARQYTWSYIVKKYVKVNTKEVATELTLIAYSTTWGK